MKKITRETTVKGLSNIDLKLPAATNVVILRTKVVCKTKVLKNKEVIKVYKDIDPVFLTKI